MQKRTAYKSSIFERAQRENFVSISPQVKEIRRAAKKGYTVIADKKYKGPGSLEGVTYTIGIDRKRIKSGLEIANPLDIYRTNFKNKAGTRFNLGDIGVGKDSLYDWFKYGSENKNFSAEARKAFEWSKNKTIATYNLGDFYDKYGVKQGKKELEKLTGQKFNDLFFRHSMGSSGSDIYPSLKGLSREKKRFFTGSSMDSVIPIDNGSYEKTFSNLKRKAVARYTRLQKVLAEGEKIGAAKFDLKYSKQLAEGVSVRNIRKKIGKTKIGAQYLGYRKTLSRANASVEKSFESVSIYKRLSQKEMMVSKYEKLAGEYRVVHVGEKAANITHRFGTKSANELSRSIGLDKIMKDSLKVASGDLELIQPVAAKAHRKALSRFTSNLTRTLTYSVGALDIALIEGKGSFYSRLRVVEAQKGFGNINLPWMKPLIEKTATGKWPIPIQKTIVGAKIAGAVGLGVLVYKHITKDKKGSNNKPFNKITGHHPGWANKKTEAAIDSTFSAGNSLLPGKTATFASNIFTKLFYKKVSRNIIKTGILKSGLRAQRKALGITRISSLQSSTIADDIMGEYSKNFSFTSKRMAIRETMSTSPSLSRNAATAQVRKQIEQIPNMLKSLTSGFVISGNLGIHPLEDLAAKGILKKNVSYVGSLSTLTNAGIVPRSAFRGKTLSEAKEIAKKYIPVVYAHETAERYGLEVINKISKKYLPRQLSRKGAVNLGSVGGLRRNLFASHISRGVLETEAYIVGGMGDSAFSKNWAKIRLLTERRGIKAAGGGFMSPPLHNPEINRGVYSEYINQMRAGARGDEFALKEALTANNLYAGRAARRRSLKLDSSKPFNKIVGHHPGWANKNTEAAINSDFTAGQSWTHVKNALAMFAKNRRKSLVSGMLATTLLASPSTAFARDIGATAARSMRFNVAATTSQRINSTRNIIDTALNITHPAATAAAKSGAVIQLGETAWHESMQLKQLRQLSQNSAGKLVPEGTARGLFGVEPETAHNWINKISERWWHWNKGNTKKVYTSYRYKKEIAQFETASGMTFKDLKALSEDEVGGLLQSNQLFGGVVAINNYETQLSGFTGNRSARAMLWQTRYQRGGVAVRSERISSYMASGQEFDRIKGHHPGWANSQTEAAIDSDFTAGHSWTHIKNAFKLFSENRIKSLSKNMPIAKKLFSRIPGTSNSPINKIIENNIKTGGKVKTQRGLVELGRRGALNKEGDLVLYHVTSKPQQTIDYIGGGLKPKGKNFIRAGNEDLQGVFVSGVPEHYKDLYSIPEASTVRITVDKRAKVFDADMMTEKRISDLLKTERGKKIDVILRADDGIEPQMIIVNSKFVKSSSLEGTSMSASAKAQANLTKAVQSKLINNPTHGLTNEVLYDRRINHTIIDQAEKTKHLFNIR